MISKKTRGALGVVATATIAALALAGCTRGDTGGEGAAASPGIDDTTITLGISTPLSGPTAGPGTCTVQGVDAYFQAANAAGGVEFGDGKTRMVEITALDDQYDPQKAKANYDQLKDSVFLMTAGLGTPTNRAWREAAIADGVPQVLIMTGDPLFSDPEQSPVQLGFVPTYLNEGAAFGELLAGSGQDLKVAILFQNDDYGQGYVEGFTTAVEGASNIEIVGQLTYESTDTSVDAQITELAATDADVIFNAMSITPLVISAMQKAQQIGWLPSWFQPSNTSSPGAILQPAGAEVFPGVYSVSFNKVPQSPAFAEDDDVVAFMDAMREYEGLGADEFPQFPHCMWSYSIGATLEEIFGKMTEPTRENFLANLRTLDGFEPPLLLPGASVTTSTAGQPAVSTVSVIKYNGTGYSPATTFGE